MEDVKARGPLVGLRVLEIGSTVAGPACGRFLADFGAEVIKIEMPEGDPLRTMGKKHEGKELYAASTLRNKKLIAVDLRKPEGQEIARALALTSDILVENFKPGTLESWGLGWDAMQKLNPRLVMVRISGYGQTGPYANRPGYGVICEGVSGLRHINGDPDRPPARAAVPMTDYISALHAAYGAVLAIMGRQHTGRGQLVDIALFESAFNFMEPWIGSYDKLGHVPGREGPRLPSTNPNNLYPTKEGSWLQITAMVDGLFRKLANAMGDPGFADDPRFRSPADREINNAALDERIGAWTRRHTITELETTLAKAGVPASRVYTIADIFADPHYKARQAIVHAPDDDLGTVAMSAVFPRLSDTPGKVIHAGHRIGQDTETVLSGVLGKSAGEIASLVERGIVALDRKLKSKKAKA